MLADRVDLGVGVDGGVPEQGGPIFVVPDKEIQDRIIEMVGKKPEEREDFLRGLREGRIADSRIAGLVKGEIVRPVDDGQGWAEAWYNVDADKQMRGIAAVGGEAGVDKMVFNRGDFDVFLEKFSTPWEFWSGPGNIRKWLSSKNPDFKFEEYGQKALQMARMLYGKQQDFFDQMVFLREEAMKEGKDKGKTESAKVENDISFNAPVVFGTDKIEGAYAVDIGGGNDYSVNEDFLVISPENQVFAVVDGAGGHGKGHEAGKIVAEEIAGLINSGGAVSEDFLERSQDIAAKRIVTEVSEVDGAAVMTAWLEGSTLNTALTGDCRCVVMRFNRATSRYDVVFSTRDQSNLNFLRNAVGQGRGGFVEHKTFPLEPGDLVTGFSDGVGDAMVDYKDVAKAVSEGRMVSEKATVQMINEGNERLSNIAYQVNGDPVGFVKFVGHVVSARVRGAGGKGDNRSMFAFRFN